jgi:hypothetical protein
MGCFAKGCVTVIVVGLIFLAGLVGCSWYLYVKTINTLTSSAPADIRVEPPTDAQYQAADSSLTRLREAIDQDTETTVEFTAADLNALFARHPDFSDWRGRIRIEIADSVMTVAVSAPLRYVKLPGTKKRWFNGTARFGFNYDGSTIDFDLKAAEAAGREIPEVFLSDYTLEPHAVLEDSSGEFWDHVKSMSIQGDKLIISTKGS